MIEFDPSKRIVVTGMGTVSPLGNDLPSTWQAAINGQSGIDIISDESLWDPRVRIAAEVKDFDPLKYFKSPQELKGRHRNVQFARAASLEALGQAKLADISDLNDPVFNFDPDEIGIVYGSGVGGAPYIGEIQKIIMEHPRKALGINPRSILNVLAERSATDTSMEWCIKGPGGCAVAACASASKAIIWAALQIRAGDADIMITGGTEAAIGRIGIGMFAATRGALDTRNNTPKESSTAFDESRQGFVMAEGAATLILESLDHALARKAPIYAELVGYGDKLDAHHETAPEAIEGYDDPEKPYLKDGALEIKKPGSVKALELAIRRAGVTPEGKDRVDYINAHGTATTLGDPAEAAAIEYVFRNFDKYPLVSSTKSMTGHLLGAAGGIESLMCIMAINEGIIPPTINLQNPINTLLDLIPNKARKTTVDIAVNNSFGFGGINAVLVFKRFQQ